MAVLNIYKLEDSEENNVVSSLKEGEHIIGRGDLLNCHDKRVSRKHAVIRVKELGASITAAHVNPCFYRPCGGSIRVLALNETVPLSDDDQFALLPTTWFKIKIGNENNGLSKNTSPESENVSQDALNANTGSPKTAQENSVRLIDGDIEITLNKRSHEDDDDDDEANKKFKAAASEQNAVRGSRSRSNSLDLLLNESLNDSYCNAVTQEVSDIPESNVQVKHESVSDNENEGTECNISVKEEPFAQSEIKQEPSTNRGETSTSAVNNENNGSGPVTNDGNQNNPTSTNADNNPTPNICRDRCWYGTTCYRKNPQHRADFSHPGDQDYDPDPSDDRPVCPFGIACYRTNFTHRRQYKHSGKPAQKPTGQATTKRKPKRKNKDDNDDENSGDEKSDENDSGQVGTTGRQKRKAVLKKKKYTDTPEDDYDYDDPFIDNASSDEFEISSDDDDDDDDDDDSDWVDSQEVDENDTKRLLKEAKRFTKGKGKKKDK